MARNTKKKKTVVVTRAEKKDATKNIIRELLATKPYRHNELIDETAKLYTERFGSEETDNMNDVKGRVGSVLDIMKKESDVAYEGGMYALKARMPVVAETVAEVKTEEKPVRKAVRAKSKKTEQEKPTEAVAEPEDTKPEKPKKTVKKTTKAKKNEEEEKNVPMPAAPMPPIAPVAPAMPEVELESIPEQPEKTEEEPAPKKRGAKAKTTTEKAKSTKKAVAKKVSPVAEKKSEEKTQEQAPMVALNVMEAETTPVEAAVQAEEPVKEVESAPAPVILEESTAKTEEARKADEKPVATNPPVVKEKGEMTTKGVVMDMSFLFGDVKPKTEKPTEKIDKQETQEKGEQEKLPAAEKTQETRELKAEKEVKKEQPRQEERKEAQKENKPTLGTQEKQLRENKPENKESKQQESTRRNARERVKNTSPRQPLTAEEKLREAFLKKMRSLGGDYFEYYSVYLLERYSMRNGRRLEGLKITGGDHDGGIDGEIELTDKLGFRETIYIQSKNWDPDKGDEKLWVVGETLLQQFIGACVCRRAKDGKQHTRGIFVTTSRFTPEAKRLLDELSDTIVGYDGNDLYETAKECEFGIIKKNGEWTLDEQLLSGTKAFFRMY